MHAPAASLQSTIEIMIIDGNVSLRANEKSKGKGRAW